MEYIYSLFGSFQLNTEKANLLKGRFEECLGDKYEDVRTEGELISTFPVQQGMQFANVFVLGNKTRRIKMGNSRIDFFFKSSDEFGTFKKLFEGSSNLLPDDFSRLAINVNYAEKDGDRSLLNKLSSKTGPIVSDSNVTEFFVRKNQRTSVLNRGINNIIIIQNGLVKDENGFGTTEGLVFSIDLNTVINLNQIEKIEKMEVIRLFEKLSELCKNDFDVINKYLEK